MDVRHFLQRRTSFIRQFYEAASAPYMERKRKIEAGEDPFVPAYREDDEPAFLEEWIEADESLHILACSCLSMLAAALHLYFVTWQKQFNAPIEPTKSEFKQGWLNGYKAYFAQHAGIHFESGPGDLKILGEVVLARNRIEHQEQIECQRPSYSRSDLDKLSHPFFVDDHERRLLAGMEREEWLWLIPVIDVTREKLLTAIEEAERFADWFEDEIYKVL